MTLYLRVTNDKYELPVAVADSKAELARMVGVHQSALTHALKDAREGKHKRTVYKIVEVEDE